jgi:hypothetical protein
MIIWKSNSMYTFFLFEPTIPASERSQTHALDGAATGIGERASSHAEYSVVTTTSFPAFPDR